MKEYSTFQRVFSKNYIKTLFLLLFLVGGLTSKAQTQQGLKPQTKE